MSTTTDTTTKSARPVRKSVKSSPKLAIGIIVALLVVGAVVGWMLVREAQQRRVGDVPDRGRRRDDHRREHILGCLRCRAVLGRRALTPERTKAAPPRCEAGLLRVTGAGQIGMRPQPVSPWMICTACATSTLRRPSRSRP